MTSDAPDRRYLFICGCARSGTTALWRLLTADPQIVLGLERYLLLTRRGEPMTPELFIPDRFFNIRPREAGMTGPLASNYYVKAADRFDTASYVGDKQPGLYRKLDDIEANLPGATVIAITRNILDIAASFQKRATDDRADAWHPDRDYRRAVSDWAEFLAGTIAFLDRPGRRTRVIVLSYEELFYGDTPAEAVLGSVMAALDLPVCRQIQRVYAEMMVKAPELEQRRGDQLTPAQRNHVALTAPFDAYRALHDRRLILA